MTIQFVVGPWQNYSPGEVYRCFVLLSPDDGGYSAAVEDLPGVASRGDTPEDALANATEALAAVLESYRDAGVPVPWATRSETALAVRRCVTVRLGK